MRLSYLYNDNSYTTFLYWDGAQLSIPGLKLNYVSKGGPGGFRNGDKQIMDLKLGLMGLALPISWS